MIENSNFIVNAIQFIRNTVTNNTISLGPKQPWQPSVMTLRNFEKEWITYFNHPFAVFYRDHECTTSDPQFAISMKIMSVQEYVKDPRSKQELFVKIPDELQTTVDLLIYFPPEYTLSALEMEVRDHNISPYDNEMAKTIHTIGQQLGTFLHKNYPDFYFEILPIGSRSYGASSTSTDYNFCVVMDDPDLDWIVKSKEKNKLVNFTDPNESNHMARLLSRYAEFKRASYDAIFNTMRYVDPVNHVEFVFNKRVYTESTDLIMYYIALDNRVGRLIAVIKQFVQLRSVTKGGLHGAGFYPYCLMLLAYLQQLDPPIIPNLQHLGFGNTDCCRVPNCRTNRKYWDTALHNKKYVGCVPYYHTCVIKDTTKPVTPNYVQQDGKGSYYWHSGNTARISELVLGFFYYYGFEFNFRKHGVSLKNGGIVAKKHITESFYIEDPFLSGVNVADPNKITRGISFFLGAFIIMYNDELCYNDALRYSGLLKIPEMKKLRTTKVSYKPLPKRRVAPAGAICFLLIGLPYKDERYHQCLCDSITERYSFLGRILHIETLDSTTKRIYLALNGSVDGREINLSSITTFDNKPVHVVKLYGFTVRA